MPAPELSGFGDGTHTFGESGLTVDGGGFGAFPGSLWIYENANRTGAADQLTVGSWNDIQLTGVAIPASPNNSAGTRHLFLQREDLAWSKGFAFTLNASGATLTIQDCLHGQAADGLALVQANVLAVQGALHGQVADSVVLSLSALLQVAATVHSHSADNLALAQAHVLAVADALHSQSADVATLIEGSTLSIAEALHGQEADNIELTVGNLLTVADAVHVQSADELVLTQAHVLVVSSALHAQIADEVGLLQAGLSSITGTVFLVEAAPKIFVVASGDP